MLMWIGGGAALIVVLALGYYYLQGNADQIMRSVGDALSSTGVGAPASQAARTPLPTPEPTEAPLVSFDTIELSGSGSNVPRFTIPESASAIAKITHKGTANFVVWSVGPDGSELELLVNTIGNYSGTVLFDALAGEHSVALEIDADGKWTATIEPIADAYVWDQTTKVTGTGDDVVLLNPPASGLTTTTITHRGSANFVVTSYSTGIDLLVNEIGDYSGETLLPDGTFLLQINADGAWSITPPG